MEIGVKTYLHRICMLFIFAFMNIANSYGQLIQAEYFWDTDPGEGNGTVILALDGNLNQAVETLFKNGINTPASIGNHKFGIRVKDHKQWGKPFYAIVNVADKSKVPDLKITQAEYFWDTDPGEGKGTTILALDGNLDQVVETLFKNGINTPASIGNHKFGIRVKDHKQWGKPFYAIVNVADKSKVPDLKITQAEYFWDTDPGEGKGTTILALDGNLDQVVETLFKNGINTPASIGNHKFGIRVKDHKQWGKPFYAIVNVADKSKVPDLKIIQAEYFWDTDPGEGKGTMILAFDGNLDQVVETLFKNGINTPASIGNHKFGIRVKDHKQWGKPFYAIVNVTDKSKVPDLKITQAEYFWDTDPGEGKGTMILALDGNLDQVVETLFQNGINTPTSIGNHKFGIRVKDHKQWGKPFYAIVNVADKSKVPDLKITQAEYFWDTDPGEGKGTMILALDGNLDQVVETLFQNGINTPTSIGNHKFGIRVKDHKQWGKPFYAIVNVADKSNVPNLKITQAEYFWDTDPGEGKGTTILAFDGNLDQVVETLFKNDVTVPTRIGMHTFNIRVKDSNGWGKSFTSVIEIQKGTNIAPVITGVVKALSTPEETALTLKLTDLTVTDPDNNYPADFSLTVQAGTNYILVGNTITPVTNFIGDLTVPVIVNDGDVNSDVFNLTVKVTPLNDKPVITGVVKALSTPEETALTLKLSDLTVTDPDNNYPTDFTLTVQAGTNYTLVGNTLTPVTNFIGDLTVPIIVNDGSVNSEVFNLTVKVTPINDKPVITGVVKALSTPEETALTLKLSDLTVTDPDNNYPTDFTLTVQAGTNYTLVENTLTPVTNFIGDLTVPVIVNDGSVNSDVFNLTVKVTPINDKPVITGVVKALSTPEETALTLKLTDLTVTDPDNNYPTDFTLTVQAGTNYTLAGNTLTPVANFIGDLTVPVIVNDGDINSDVFNLSVKVTPLNDKPVITGVVKALSTPEETALTLKLTDLTVTDPDNNYPTDFTLTVQAGTNYTLVGNTITPVTNFIGDLTVPVIVNDGSVNSDVFNLTVKVTPINDKPVITGVVKALSTPEETALTLKLSDLTVTDPDNNYPTDFTLTVQAGTNYILVGNTITPVTNFIGDLTVPVIVNDGSVNSDVFNLSVKVTPLNDKPVITGVVKALSTPEETALTLKLSDLTVTDPDNNYPTDFTLTVQAGSNYTLVGNTLTPVTNFIGDLTVPIIVNDGSVNSEVFNLSVKVTPLNDKPVITGVIKALSTPEETALTLKISDLMIDGKNYTNGFDLLVQTGGNYSLDGSTITPIKDFNGVLTVPVKVHDGRASSDVYELSIQVTPINDAPAIIGLQRQVFTPQNSRFTIHLEDLIVEDPDNNYPDDFTLTILDGQGYTYKGQEVIIEGADNDQLEVSVKVNDGTDDSNIYQLLVGIRTGKVNVFPNPTTGVFIMSFSSGYTTPVAIKLMNIKGEILQDLSIEKSDEVLQQTMSLHHLSSGVYLLEVVQGDYRAIKRIVKH